MITLHSSCSWRKVNGIFHALVDNKRKVGIIRWMLLLFLILLDYNPQTLTVPPFKHTFGFYRASKYYLQLFLGPNYDYNDPQGIAAVKLEELDDPETHRDDDELAVFAVNSGVGQIVYNIGLTSVKAYGDTNAFSEPKGIAAGVGGLVAVADFGNRRVVKLRYHAGELKQLAEISIPGRPFGVCLDSEDNLYVTDFDNSRIYVFSPDDSLMFQFGVEGRAQGEIYQPMGIAVIDAKAPDNFEKDDFLVVTDNYGTRISKFSRNGRFMGSVQSYDLGLVEGHFLYAAIDYYGSIYITDEANNQIHKFDRNLTYIISVGRTGTGGGEFLSPRGISIWRKFGQVFISEQRGGQYLWLAVDGFVVGCFPEVFNSERPGTTLAIYLTDDARVYITITNQRGEQVRDFIEGVRRTPGEYLIVWDGRDDNNILVPPGEYVFHIRLKGLHGHGRRINKLMKAGVTCVAI
jgi:DNA-binding beta-propeller fold protein YncE